jgi:hypothetical protein
LDALCATKDGLCAIKDGCATEDCKFFTVPTRRLGSPVRTRRAHNRRLLPDQRHTCLSSAISTFFLHALVFSLLLYLIVCTLLSAALLSRHGGFPMIDPLSNADPGGAVPQPLRLLDQLRQAALAHFGRPESGQRFADWTRRFILFHDKRHPRDMGLPEVARFLEHLAQTEKDPLAALEQAREALDFLYQRLLQINLGELPFPEPPRLLDRLRRALRVRHYSPRTEECYVDWAERFIRFHGMRHRFQ